jgi:hypothetical protein
MPEPLTIKVKLITDDFKKEMENAAKSFGNAFRVGASGKESDGSKTRSGLSKEFSAGKNLVGLANNLPPPPYIPKPPKFGDNGKETQKTFLDMFKEMIPKMGGIGGGMKGTGGAGVGGLAAAGGVAGVAAGAVLGILGGIKDAVQGITDFIVKTSPLLQSVLQLFQTLVGLLFMPLAMLISSFLLPIAAFMMILFVPILRAVMPHISSIIAFLVTFATQFANLIVPFLTQAMAALSPALDFFSKVLAVIGAVGLVALFSFVVTAILSVVLAIEVLYNGIAGIVNTAIDVLGTVILGGLKLVYDAIFDAIKPIADFFGVGKFVDVMKKAGDDAFDGMKKVLNDMKLPTSSIFNELNSHLGDVNNALGLNTSATDSNTSGMSQSWTISQIAAQNSIFASALKEGTITQSQYDTAMAVQNSNMAIAQQKASAGATTKTTATGINEYNGGLGGTGIATFMQQGGYTGNKTMLAMLHPEEWVLNKEQMRGLLTTGLASRNSGESSNQQNVINVGGITINGGVGGLTVDQIKHAVSDAIATGVRRRRTR